MSVDSQTAMILGHLRSGKSITPLDALDLFGCFRLGARIYDLRQSGHKIEKELIDVGGRWVAEYRMECAQ